MQLSESDATGSGRVVVAVVAEQEADRLAIAAAFATQSDHVVVHSATIEAAGALLGTQPLDAIVGFIDEQADWLRFRELAARHTDIPSVLLISDPERLDGSADGRVLNAVVGVPRKRLAKQAGTITSDVLATLDAERSNMDADGDRNKLEMLSKREKEILTLTASGLAIKEIAAKIDRTYATVASHRARIMTKLDLHDKVALTRFAIRMDLLDA